MSIIEELKLLQAEVKTLNTKREALLGQIGGQKAAVEAAHSQLEQLGVINSRSLTLDQLTALESQKKTELDGLMTSLRKEITQANSTFTEYESLSKG